MATEFFRLKIPPRAINSNSSNLLSGRLEDELSIVKLRPNSISSECQINE